MRKILFLFICMYSAWGAFAQETDSLFVTGFKSGWAIVYKVESGDDVFSVARKYHVPPAKLADANDINFQQRLKPGAKMLVPLEAYNFLTARPRGNDVRALFFKTKEAMGLRKIARASGVSQYAIQRWNKLETNELRKGQILKVGWVLYDQTKILRTPKPVVKTEAKAQETELVPRNPIQRETTRTETIYIPLPDTTRTDTLSEGEKLFSLQTYNGSSVATEKGKGVFFPRTGKSTNDIYFAFHETAKRGTILKVFNPGTGTTVYAKVIGKLPNTGAFHDALFGISDDAKTALGTVNNKIWCEISYAP